MMGPVEFVVEGIPAVPRSRRIRRQRWRAAVQAAARARFPERAEPIARDVRVVLVYFHAGEAGRDIDNIAKLALDALSGPVIADDGLVAELTARRTALVEGLVLDDPPASVVAALEQTSHFLYVRIDAPPDHRRLP